LKRVDRVLLARERSCKYLLAFVYIPWCDMYMMSMMMNEISQHINFLSFFLQMDLG
jgi:hypothetical protein